MKKLVLILPLALILCFMVGCQDKAAMAELEEFRAQAAVEEQNQALVARYHDAWAKGDVEAIKEILSPEYVWHSLYGAKVDLERTLINLERQKAMFTDRINTIEDTVAKGDRVVVRYLAKFTLGDDVKDMPVKGKIVEFGGIEIMRIASDKIVEIWELVDWLYFNQQLGMELKPKEGEK